MPASHVETDWSLAVPARYRDRIQWDPINGAPACIDVAAGSYTVPTELTNADRLACNLPPTIVRPSDWR